MGIGLIELLLLFVVMPLVWVGVPVAFVLAWRAWIDRPAPAFQGCRVPTLRRAVALFLDLALAGLPYRAALMDVYGGDLAWSCLIPLPPSLHPAPSEVLLALMPGLAYLLFRSAWGGRFSVGTRLMGYRVVRAADGTLAGPVASVLRNGLLTGYLGCVAVLSLVFGVNVQSVPTLITGGLLVGGGPVIVAVGMAATHASRQGRRLGDLLAGTVALDG